MGRQVQGHDEGDRMSRDLPPDIEWSLASIAESLAQIANLMAVRLDNTHDAEHADRIRAILEGAK